MPASGFVKLFAGIKSILCLTQIAPFPPLKRTVWVGRCWWEIVLGGEGG